MRDPLVLIVEDHPMMVDALCAHLRELMATAVFIHAGSLAHGLQQLTSHPNIDLLLLDLNLPDAQGLQTLQAFCNARPHGAILVFSVVESSDVADMCLGSGVEFLSKTEPVTRLAEKVLHTLQHSVAARATEETVSKLVAHEPDIERIGCLSDRQLHVLSQLARGKRSRDVAMQLGIEESTVRTHQNSIYQRLGVKNKTQASAVYWQWAHRLGQPHVNTSADDENI
jgi:DNA-binding NarL/FixJ family response regulator